MSTTTTICFVNSHPSWGGGEKWHLDMALRLQERGFRVVFFVQRGGELEEKVRAHNLPHEPVNINNYSFLNPFKTAGLTRLFRKHSVDAVILNLPSDVKIAGRAARRAGVEKIVYRRGTALPVHNNFFNRNLFRRVVTHIVTNSQETKKLLLERNPRMVDSSKIHVIYNGIDFEAFDRHQAEPAFNHSEETLVLGNAGRFVEQKGHPFLLDVARKLKDKDVSFKLLLAGEGKLRDTIGEQVRREQLDDHVKFTGFISDIKAFMQSIDLFVLTSLWEGFGYVIVEAMASYKPVVAFDISSNPEIIRHGENGYLAPMGDTDAFVERILELHRDPQKREEMGRRARAFAEEHFDIHRTVSEIEAMLLNNNT